MKYIAVPELAGHRMSRIGLGCWSLGGGSGWSGSSDQESLAVVGEAIDLGITVLDTAPIYGFGLSETILGKALKARRNEVFLASKCGLVWDEGRNVRRDLSAKSVRSEVDASLVRLNTDRIDLLQLHWPDHDTPLEETATALAELLASGKVGHVGVSNFSLADTRALGAMVPVASYQGLYNLLERNAGGYHDLALEYRTQAEILPHCRASGLAFLAYSPLCQGLLAGALGQATPFGPEDVRNSNPGLAGATLRGRLDAVAELAALSDDLGITIAQLALAWLCAEPGVTSALCGAQRPDQIRENARAADVVLPEEVLRRIETVIEAELV